MAPFEQLYSVRILTVLTKFSSYQLSDPRSGLIAIPGTSGRIDFNHSWNYEKTAKIGR